jgi:hypothetical protein
LLKGTLAAAAIGAFIAATIAGTWAAYSYSSATAQSHNAATDQSVQSQISNASTKGDRLSSTTPVAVEILPRPQAVPDIVARPNAAAWPTSYAVAALATTVVEPPKPRTDVRKPTSAASDKARRAEQQKLLLDDTQIASLRTRLKLTPTQEEFWPAVEITLRDVVRAHARKFRGKPDSYGAPQIDVNSPEVQQLITAAVPLIMRLSEEQKHEVRTLARIIGLETVASKI